ncbi:hypothetical protein BU24DRAFT_92350 [Aaosphaeria arxii CBS 175.79]|uniref:Uncharacterized protein n=1 Tax=Aaosphaeria arxii CBS 175.79 TaxID=1450172 RepID=A0A6A5X7P5_9PLEO|nr:uncharacterized protein BU24DRAFT_92350 [Aaosphaeria arxii CBS 175.79]KAF2008837.1 hypothetical protein BU24DRAFT_92350 [Aaosphaeria arxii CBS 175.79]
MLLSFHQATPHSMFSPTGIFTPCLRVWLCLFPWSGGRTTFQEFFLSKVFLSRSRIFPLPTIILAYLASALALTSFFPFSPFTPVFHHDPYI